MNRRNSAQRNESSIDLLAMQDLHTHTPFSGCGKVRLENIKEVIKELEAKKEYELTSNQLRRELVKKAVKDYISIAKRRGIKYIGFTDHLGPFTSPLIYEELKNILKEVEKDSIKIYVGAEIEILEISGKTPLSKEMLSGKVDYVMAGLHHYNYFSPPSSSVEEIVNFIFKEIINAINNPDIDALAHPWIRAIKRVAEVSKVELKFSDFPEELIYKSFEEAKRKNKPVNVVFKPEWLSSNVDKKLAGIETMYRAIADTECPIFYGSDTHTPSKLGEAAKELYEYFKSLGADLLVWLPEERD